MSKEILAKDIVTDSAKLIYGYCILLITYILEINGIEQGKM